METSADTRSPVARAQGLVVAALIAATGAYGLGFWILRDVGPPPEAFPAAARVVREGYAPGDLILLVPFYATRAREHLGDLQPVAPREPLREDLRGHGRVWLFGLFGEAERLAPALAAAGLVPDGAWDPAPGIHVARWRVEPSWRTTYDFTAQLADAKVVHEHSDGTREACAAWSATNGQGGPGGKWTCPHDGEWFYVAPEWHRMGDHPRWCFWAHPPSDGRLLIQFPRVPLAGHVVGRGGHTLNSSVYARERVDLDVIVGDARPQRFGFALTDHWRPFILDTPSTGTATVTFAVSSPDAGANHFCFTASVRAAPWEARGRPVSTTPRWRLPR